MSKEILSQSNNEDRRPVIRKLGRQIGFALGIGTICVLNYNPDLVDKMEKVLFSSNVDGYTWRIDTQYETCFSDISPTLSDGFRKITIQDAYCPTNINGKNQFEEVTLPTDSSTGVTRIEN
jgi:hypothetical protein